MNVTENSLSNLSQNNKKAGSRVLNQMARPRASTMTSSETMGKWTCLNCVCWTTGSSRGREQQWDVRAVGGVSGRRHRSVPSVFGLSWRSPGGRLVWVRARHAVPAADRPRRARPGSTRDAPPVGRSTRRRRRSDRSAVAGRPAGLLGRRRAAFGAHGLVLFGTRSLAWRAPPRLGPQRSTGARPALRRRRPARSRAGQAGRRHGSAAGRPLRQEFSHKQLHALTMFASLPRTARVNVPSLHLFFPRVRERERDNHPLLTPKMFLCSLIQRSDEGF